MSFYLPKGYHSKLSLIETEVAIKAIKDSFQTELSQRLNLLRVSAPYFVQPETGLNDNLNGIERAVSFDVPDLGGSQVEIVHSLAKWKRDALYRYEIPSGQGIYTDMDAIRRDEVLDNTHSLYVDQWDWEKHILQEERTQETLHSSVKSIFEALKATEERIQSQFHVAVKIEDEISFVTTQELEDRWPEKSPKERERLITEEKGALFLEGIGGKLKSGKIHDGRAPDYDDWGLNGDILVWNPVLNDALELSSMGIRVDENSLLSQLKESGCEERADLPFHQNLLQKRLPYSMGGGIGQSRLCMFFLQKAHIGEVQVALWPESMQKSCREVGIKLL